jgi:competence ComEA-like helix-hairpin-helix protein
VDLRVLKLVFTPQEKRVFLFILATFLLGGAIRLYNHYHLQAQLLQLDSLDREFLTRAQSLPGPGNTVVDSNSASEHVDASCPGSNRAVTLSGPVDINQADTEELESLPGIGPVLAKRIVEWRRQQGPFRSEDDLLQVRGIGPQSLKRIQSQIVVGTKP